jgi:hypothetical protein
MSAYGDTAGRSQRDPNDFKKLIGVVARDLLGVPNRKLSNGHVMRWRTRGSLRVNLDEGVWEDHETGDEGGTLDLVIRERGFKHKDYAAAAQWLEDNGYLKPDPRAPKKGGALGRIVAEFDYVDAAGKLLFQVVKYDPKDFRQRRPDGKGGWVWNLDGVQKVLYRLPELIEDVAQRRTIVIVEGEKDCDALRAIGVPATCNPGGAGKWEPAYNEWLLDADVVIVGDNDPHAKHPKTGELLFHPDGRPVFPGQDHMRDVAAKLVNTAKRIRLIDLGKAWPGCPLKGDIYDFLQSHTREQFDALADALPEYAATDTPAAAFALDSFCAYMPMHQYIYLPTGELWPASSVDSKAAPVGNTKASAWLDKNKSVEQMTWAPGLPVIVPDRIVANGGWADQRGVAVFNLYKPPTIAHGDATRADPWVDHVRRVYPADADHIINYLAHRVQRPQEKINHGLVLGGPPGVGKDTLIEPVKRAVGPWNVQEVSPQQVLGRFNGFVKAVILRISEARDLGELNRFAFYEHLKIYLAAPPEVIRCDEKNLREHSVLNVMGVIITSNRKDSFFLPADDRRHYVAWTDLTPEDFTEAYWQEIWNWYEEGGDQHVAAYLAALDISHFKPKAPPPKTSTFWEIVETNRTPENSELADALDALGNPNAVTLDMIRRETVGNICDWISDRKNARQIPHRMSECGYVPVRNEAAKDGLWRISDKRQVVYAKAELSVRERHEAVWAMAATQQQGL